MTHQNVDVQWIQLTVNSRAVGAVRSVHSGHPSNMQKPPTRKILMTKGKNTVHPLTLMDADIRI